VRLEGLGKLKKYNDLTGNGTRDRPACSIVPQLITPPRAPKIFGEKYKLPSSVGPDVPMNTATFWNMMLCNQTFRRNMLRPSSWSKYKLNMLKQQILMLCQQLRSVDYIVT
jgi:hypothetical protein